MWEHTRNFHEGQVGEVGGMGDFKASVVIFFVKVKEEAIWQNPSAK